MISFKNLNVNYLKFVKKDEKIILTRANKCFIISKHKGCDEIIKVINDVVVCIRIYILLEKVNSYYGFRLAEDEEEYIYENYNLIKIKKSSFYDYGIKNINNKYEVIKKVYERLKDKYVSNNNVNKNIYNNNLNIFIEIWKSGIKETFGNDKYYKSLPTEIKVAKIITMDYLDEFVKYGKKRAEDASNYHDCKSRIMFSYLKIPILIDDVNYEINLDIKKEPNGKNKFYIHNLIKKEINPSQSQCG